MILLAIDPGNLSGWALSKPRLSGQVDHQETARCEWWELTGHHTKAAWKALLAEPDRTKRVLAAGSRWLEHLCATFVPEVVVLEEQGTWGYQRAVAHMMMWRGAYLATLGRLDMAVVMVPPSDWQAGGRKTWVNGDPEADKKSAEAILAWALEQPHLRAA